MSVDTPMSKFEYLRENKPSEGEVVISLDGDPVPVRVETGFIERKMFVNAIIDDDCTGWYLSSGNRGLKMVLVPEAQEQLIALNYGSLGNLKVSALRVVRASFAGTCLLSTLVD